MKVTTGKKNISFLLGGSLTYRIPRHVEPDRGEPYDFWDHETIELTGGAMLAWAVLVMFYVGKQTKTSKY
jgi:hypothetical protein